MGYNARNDEIRDSVTRMRRAREADAERWQRSAVSTPVSAKGYAWFRPKIAAALTSKHHWLIVACDGCDTVVDLDLRVKPRPGGQHPRGAATGCNARAATGTVPAHNCVVAGADGLDTAR